MVSKRNDGRPGQAAYNACPMWAQCAAEHLPIQIICGPSPATSSLWDSPAEQGIVLLCRPAPRRHRRAPESRYRQKRQRSLICRPPAAPPVQWRDDRRRWHSRGEKLCRGGAAQIPSLVRANKCRHLRKCNFPANRPTLRARGAQRRIALRRHRKSQNTLHRGTDRPASLAGCLERRLSRCGNLHQRREVSRGTPTRFLAVSVHRVFLNCVEREAREASCWPQVAARKPHGMPTRVPQGGRRQLVLLAWPSCLAMILVVALVSAWTSP